MSRKVTIVFEKNWDAIHAKNEDGSSVYRYIVNMGSSRSSKTISLIDLYDMYARSNYNKRLTVWRDTKTDCKKTVLADAIRRFKAIGSYKVLQEFNKTESIFTYTATDSTFEIHGTDDEQTVMGLTQDCAWFNEPYKISRDIFDQVDQRTSDFVFIDYNPKMGHWVDDLMKDPRTFVIYSTFQHNPFCPPEQRAKILSYQPLKWCEIVTSASDTEKGGIEQMLRSYDQVLNKNGYDAKQLKEIARCLQNEFQNSASEFKWQVYGLGLKAERPNRIFAFNEIPDSQYFAIRTKEIICVDWGSVDPFGILSMKYHDGELYLHQLNYASENKIRERLTATELQQVNQDDEGGLVVWLFNKLGIGKDCEVICDTNRPLKIAALRRAGWPYATGANKAAGSIIDGIDLINDLKAVNYTASSTDLKYEQENYSRKVDRYGVVLEEPEDVDNHLIDPTRYGAQHLKAKGIIKRL